MKAYVLNGKEYLSMYELRRENSNLVFPNNPSEELLKEIGITILDRPDPTPPDPPEIDKLQEAKMNRMHLVNEIVVEVDGMSFDGNEDAQRRMNNAITAAKFNNEDTVNWVLHDNTVQTVTIEQLSKAHALAVEEMSIIWTSVYEEE